MIFNLNIEFDFDWIELNVILSIGSSMKLNIGSFLERASLAMPYEFIVDISFLKMEAKFTGLSLNRTRIELL